MPFRCVLNFAPHLWFLAHAGLEVKDLERHLQMHRKCGKMGDAADLQSGVVLITENDAHGAGRGRRGRRRGFFKRVETTPIFRNTPSTAGNSMTGSERSSLEPFLKKKRGVPSRTGGGENSGNALEALKALNYRVWGSQPYSWGEFQETLSERFRGLSGIFPEFLPQSPSRAGGMDQICNENAPRVWAERKSLFVWKHRSELKGQMNRGDRTKSVWEGNLPLRGSLRGRVFRGGFQRFWEIFQRFSEVLSETLCEADFPLRGSQPCCPYSCCPLNFLQEEPSMDQCQSRGKLLTNFQGHWSIQILKTRQKVIPLSQKSLPSSRQALPTGSASQLITPAFWCPTVTEKIQKNYFGNSSPFPCQHMGEKRTGLEGSD